MRAFPDGKASRQNNIEKISDALCPKVDLEGYAFTSALSIVFQKKARTHNLKEDAEEALPSGPCSFVVKKGRVDKTLSELVSDLRQLMSPNTYSKLKDSKRSTAQDYVQVAGSLGATHLIRVSKNEKNVAHMYMSRLPAGPSFDFRIDQLSLISDIRRQVQSGGIGLSREDERYPPVAILHGFKNAENEFVSLLCEALKGLIPPIDIHKINMKTCRRVVLFSYSTETETLSIRHFRISLGRKTVADLPSVSSCGIVLNARSSSKIPNLGNLVSIADLVAPRAIEEDAVELGKRGMTSLSLIEIGPRIDATLSRVLSGVEEGTVLHARFAAETVGSTVVKKVAKRARSKGGLDSTKKRIRSKGDLSYENEEDLNEYSE